MKKTGHFIFLGIVFLFLYAPILILAVYSFTNATMIGQFSGLSLHNYYTLFTSEELLQMIIGTVVLEIVVSVLSTILGTVGAIGSFYSKKRPRGLIDAANQIPVINAEVVTGFSVCILMIGLFHIKKDTFIPLVVGQTVLCAPFVYLGVIPKLKQMDEQLYAAALDLGWTPFMALNKVVIPQIIPGIISGFMLSITLSLDDYFIATYTKPSTFQTISTYVVNATKGAQTEIKTALWALSTLIFLFVVAIAVGANILENKDKDK